MPFDRGRHDRHTEAHQQARYHLRQGMAKVALRAKRSGQPVVDCAGRPLLYANRVSEQVGTATIERWAKGWGAKAAPGKPTQVWCAPCKSDGREPFQDWPHDHEARGR